MTTKVIIHNDGGECMYNVLLVDDDKLVRYYLKKMNLWEKYGFIISDEAGDGFEALKKVSSSHFDLAIVDIKMPRVDGIEFLKELKEIGSNLCVVFMSRYSEFSYARQGIILGAFDYILKPVDEKYLIDVLSRVNNYLRNKKNEKEIMKKLADTIGINISDFSQDRDEAIKDFHLNHGNAIIRNVCKYVLLHSDERMSLETISNVLGFSSCYLSRLFKLMTGEGFNEYVTKVKMERAKSLLQTGKYKNYEISDILHYGNADYFCSLFKKYTGVTPVKYRQSINPNWKCE